MLMSSPVVGLAAQNAAGPGTAADQASPGNLPRLLCHELRRQEIKLISDDVECPNQLVKLVLGDTTLPVDRLSQLTLGHKLGSCSLRSRALEGMPENSAHVLHRSVSHDSPNPPHCCSFGRTCEPKRSSAVSPPRSGRWISTLDSKLGSGNCWSPNYAKYSRLQNQLARHRRGLRSFSVSVVSPWLHCERRLVTRRVRCDGSGFAQNRALTFETGTSRRRR